MAESFYKSLDIGKDVVATRTLLHEAIPLTGTIVSGTYGTANIKNYAHGMFQSVYDYPYLSSSANHIFDITVGVSANSSLYSSVTSQKAKKLNIYNQMAQVLVGYDHTGSIQRFDEDGDIMAGGTKLDEVMFMNFSRLLTKDEIKKGTFSLTLGVNSSYSSPMAKTITITDASGSDGYLVNSPVGEYGVLFASQGTGSPLTTNNVKCGLLFYQAGVMALSSSVFDTSAASAATATITFTGNQTTNRVITITSTDGTERTYSAKTTANAAAGTFDGNNGAADCASTLAAAINNNDITGHASKITATNPTSTTVLLTQDVNGVAGNTTISSTLDAATVPAAFTGGGDGNGILLTSLGASDMTSGATFESFKSLLKTAAISGSADALRHRINNLQFNNTVELNSSVYFCRVNHNEFNYSTNPTYLSGSKIRVKTQSSDLPVSYITTVGLYNDNNELLATAKLSEPLKKSSDTEFTIRVRLDY